MQKKQAQVSSYVVAHRGEGGVIFRNLPVSELEALAWLEYTHIIHNSLRLKVLNQGYGSLRIDHK